MSAGDVPRCPSCGLYLYPSDTATVHLCGVPYPNNAPASYPLKDWRDAEIESLRTDYVLLSDDYKQLLGDNERLRSRLAKLQGGEACCVTHGEGACQLTCTKCNDDLRSRLAEAEYQWKYWMGVADDNGIKSIKARLAEAEALLLDIAEMRVSVLPSRFMDESMAEAARAYLARTP
jgi:hypothetical protein